MLLMRWRSLRLTPKVLMAPITEGVAGAEVGTRVTLIGELDMGGLVSTELDVLAVQQNSKQLSNQAVMSTTA